VRVLDLLKAMGFKYSTSAGISIGMVDMIVPEGKAKIIEEARRQVKDVERQYQKGIITEGERYNKIIDIWTRATEETAASMIAAMQKKQSAGAPNSLFMMVDSGRARQPSADPSAGRYARAHGQAVRRNH